MLLLRATIKTLLNSQFSQSNPKPLGIRLEPLHIGLGTEMLKRASCNVSQGVATGRYHAGLLTNREEWERACVSAGRSSGDLVQPLVFSPELHFSEFSSAMADMKNFVSEFLS